MALSKWAQSLLPSLTTRLGALGVPASAIPAFAAQLDIETGGGTSYGVRKRNNVAGIGGRNNYAVYPTLDAGIGGYVGLLSTKRYANVIAAARTGDPAAVAKALGNSPWAEHRYRKGASGDEYSGGSGIPGTEGWAILNKLGGTKAATGSDFAGIKTSGSASTDPMEQIINGLGWRKNPDGTYTDPQGKTHTEAEMRQPRGLLDVPIDAATGAVSDWITGTGARLGVGLVVLVASGALIVAGIYSLAKSGGSNDNDET